MAANTTNDTSSSTESKGQGFQRLSKIERSRISSKGGKAAHEQGVAHEWNTKEAQAAGREGGRARSRNQKNKARQ